MRLYETEDILCAAFLQSYGHFLSETKAHPAKRNYFLFVFQDPQGSVEKDGQKFLNDGLVPVRTLARNLSKLRNRSRENRFTNTTNATETTNDRYEESPRG